MKRTCSWRRQLEGTKPVEAKDRVNDYETCESDELLQGQIILCTKRKAWLNKNYTKTYMYTATKHLLKMHSLIFYKPQENRK